MTTYTVTLADGQTFLMEADLSKSSAAIRANFHSDEDGNNWQSTPYQTADADHFDFKAATLVAEYFADGDDCIEVERVE